MTLPFFARVRRVARRQSGFTLIEVTLTAGLLGVVVIALLAVADTSSKLAPKDQERAHAVREAQTGLHQMTRELRQAHEVSAADAHVMQVKVSGEDVTYRCDQAHPTDTRFRRCVRFAGGEERVVIDRLLNGVAPDAVFEPRTDADTGRVDYVSARVVVPAAGDRKNGHPHRIVFQDGFYMRNQDLR